MSSPEARERLRHSPNEAIIGITRSPAGEPCVGMTLNGEEWALLVTAQSPSADAIRKRLKEELDIDTLSGLPVDRKASIASSTIVIKVGKDKPHAYVGVFVPEKQYDRIKTEEFTDDD